MNRDALVQMFKDNNVQGILFQEYLEHSNLEKRSHIYFQQLLMMIQHKLVQLGISFNEYTNYVIQEIRNKYAIMFVFNDKQQVIQVL